jgi:hypothetical protein
MVVVVVGGPEKTRVVQTATPQTRLPTRKLARVYTLRNRSKSTVFLYRVTIPVVRYWRVWGKEMGKGDAATAVRCRTSTTALYPSLREGERRLAVSRSTRRKTTTTTTLVQEKQPSIHLEKGTSRR